LFFSFNQQYYTLPYLACSLNEELTMAVSRLQIENNKKKALLQHQMRDVAKLLAEVRLLMELCSFLI